MALDRQQIMAWLEAVKDPEIPVLSLVDLGVINEVHIQDKNVSIDMTPTFVGCPAIDMMKEDIVNVLRGHGVEQVDVQVTFKHPWTSDKISEKGKQALKKWGLAPPPSAQVFHDLEVLENAPCPRCGGENTELKNPFGPTLCRSIHYCHTCKEAFEQFKPVS